MEIVASVKNSDSLATFPMVATFPMETTFSMEKRYFHW